MPKPAGPTARRQARRARWRLRTTSTNARDQPSALYVLAKISSCHYSSLTPGAFRLLPCLPRLQPELELHVYTQVAVEARRYEPPSLPIARWPELTSGRTLNLEQASASPHDLSSCLSFPVCRLSACNLLPIISLTETRLTRCAFLMTLPILQPTRPVPNRLFDNSAERKTDILRLYGISGFSSGKWSFARRRSAFS